MLSLPDLMFDTNNISLPSVCPTLADLHISGPFLALLFSSLESTI